jgi:hypothetical protein
MAENGRQTLDRAFDALERETPDWMGRALRWVRHPKSRWVRIPLGLLLIAQDVPFLRKPVGRAVLWLVAKWRQFRAWWKEQTEGSRVAENKEAYAADKPRRRRAAPGAASPRRE